MNSLLLDVRAALRSFARRRSVFAVMVVAMALAIGANTTVFSVLRAFFAGSMGFPGDERVVSVFTLKDLPGRGEVRFSDAYPNFRLMRESGFSSLQAIAAVHPTNLNWELPEETRRIQGASVTASFFEVLQLRPVLGRLFRPDEEGPNAVPVALVSHRFWQSALGGAPDVIGRSLRLNNQAIEIIGVLPPGFSQPTGADIWRPFDLPENLWTAITIGRRLQFLGRLAAGADLTSLNTELRAFGQRALEASPENKDWRWRAAPMRELLLDNAPAVGLFVQLGAGVLLVLALSNLIALLLAWAAERERETAVRLALGASTSRLIRQFLVQSGLLALIGGTAGIALAAAALPVVQQLVPGDQLSVFLANARLDVAALGFSGAMIAGTALIAGLIPAWHVRRTNLEAALRSETRGASAGGSSLRWQRAMVVVQTAVATLILIAATLAGLGFHRLSQVPLGYLTEHRVAFRVQLPDATFSTHEKRARLVREFERALATRPEFSAFAIASPLPVGEGQWGGSFHLELPEGGFTPDPLVTTIRRVSPSYLGTMGIPLLEGRDFAATDRTDTPHVAIISKTMAERYWPGQSPLGKRLKRASPADAPIIEIVGVAADVRDGGPDREPGETVYTLLEQFSSQFFSTVLVARGSPEQALAAGRGALRSLSPEIAAYAPAALADLAANANALPRLQMILLGTFASIAAVLAGLGCYGVMSQLATIRRREMAVRLALGASPASVRGLFLQANARLSLAGSVLGAGAAWAVARWAEGRLPGFDPRLGWVYFAILGAMLLLTQAAGYLPARRLAKLDVQQTLTDS
jgi:predicted permease